MTLILTILLAVLPPSTSLTPSPPPTSPNSCGGSLYSVSVIYPDTTITMQVPCFTNFCSVHSSHDFQGKYFLKSSDDFAEVKKQSVEFFSEESEQSVEISSDMWAGLLLLSEKNTTWLRIRRSHGTGKLVIFCESENINNYLKES